MTKHITVQLSVHASRMNDDNTLDAFVAYVETPAAGKHVIAALMLSGFSVTSVYEPVPGQKVVEEFSPVQSSMANPEVLVLEAALRGLVDRGRCMGQLPDGCSGPKELCAHCEASQLLQYLDGERGSGGNDSDPSDML